MVHATRSPNCTLNIKETRVPMWRSLRTFLSSRNRCIEIHLSERRIQFWGLLHCSDRHSHKPWLIGAVQCTTSHPGIDLRINLYLVVLKETIARCWQANLGQLVPPLICNIPRNDRSCATQEFLDHDVIVKHCWH